MSFIDGRGIAQHGGEQIHKKPDLSVHPWVEHNDVEWLTEKVKEMCDRGMTD